ncbi:hypothetical protein GE09DRAFT_1050831 [Coniochaeta sp. 2T2.1]|nr:hypothetical protein GE09DRAFT_1050831 [Coniochaeta sp. 2T2.1]
MPSTAPVYAVELTSLPNKNATDLRVTELVAKVSQIDPITPASECITEIVDMIRRTHDDLKADLAKRAAELSHSESESEGTEGVGVATKEPLDEDDRYCLTQQWFEEDEKRSDDDDSSDDDEQKDDTNAAPADGSTARKRGATVVLRRRYHLYEHISQPAGTVRLTLAGLPYDLQGRILLRRHHINKGTYKFWELGQAVKELAPPTTGDIIIDERAENLRLFFEAYFLIRKKKDELRNKWLRTYGRRVGRSGLTLLPEFHDGLEQFSLSLDRIEAHNKQFARNGYCLLTSVLEMGKGGCVKRASKGSVVPRRLILSRGRKERHMVYVDAATGAAVRRSDGDIVLPESEETYEKLRTLVYQTLRNLSLAHFFPELKDKPGRLCNKRSHEQINSIESQPSKKARNT